jgi:prepilin-type N-terminal cleavage/methylation domain-containing protein
MAKTERRNLRPGFTLLELLVVIGLLTASFAIAAPALSRFCAQFLLKTSAQALASDLRLLQTRAVLRHKTLSLDPSEYPFPAKIKLAKGKIIAFSADGFPPPGGTGTIVIQNDLGNDKKIIVSNLGRVRIE